jgi:hypothetical protein
MRSHMLSHVAYYAYKCQYCDRPSKRMSDLRKHEKGCRVGKDKQQEKVGTEFDTFQDFKTAMNTWAVAGRFGIRVVKFDRKRNVIRCRDSAECVFNVICTSKKRASEGQRQAISKAGP